MWGLRTISRTLAVALPLTMAILGTHAMQATAQTLCSIPPKSYGEARVKYPQVAFALNEIEKRGIATWYTDRKVNGDHVAIAQRLISECDPSTRLNVVVYGLPNKDCEHSYSSDGVVKNAQDYEQFIGVLASAVGQRKALFVLEPDAVGLLAKDGSKCANDAGYLPNLQNAIRILSANPNAEIYIDIGYWTVAKAESAGRVAAIVRELARAGRVKGITLNTSNYRSNDELARLCGNFQQAYGSWEMKCIIDTSRNFNGAPTDEWCNLRTAGIGAPPTSNTGIPNIDYFLWLKTPGDSDGECNNGRTNLAMPGPEAGQFFLDGFSTLWSQGFFVQREKMPRVGEYVPPPPSPVPTTPAPTPAPSPSATTLSPAPTEVLVGSSTNATDLTASSSSHAIEEAFEGVFADWKATTGPPSTATPPPTPQSTTPSPGIRVETKTESASSSASVFAIVALVAIAAAAVAIVVVVRVRRRRLVESKEPRISMVSYTSMRN